MTDQPFVPIVREPELPRLTAAGAAVRAEMDRLTAAGVDRADLVAGLYAARALTADDDHGREHGVVVQADGLLWAELTDLVGLARSGARPGPARRDRHLAPGLPGLPRRAGRRPDPDPPPLPHRRPLTGSCGFPSVRDTQSHELGPPRPTECPAGVSSHVPCTMIRAPGFRLARGRWGRRTS